VINLEPLSIGRDLVSRRVKSDHLSHIPPRAARPSRWLMGMPSWGATWRSPRAVKPPRRRRAGRPEPRCHAAGTWKTGTGSRRLLTLSRMKTRVGGRV